LHVDRKEFVNGKPLLRIQGVFQIWPDGQFTPLFSCVGRRWVLPELKTLEKLTFLRWGYVARQKAVWVQDTARRGYSYYNWGAVDREPPDQRDYQRRTPYLPLDGVPLFDDRIKYRLKRAANDKWVIAASGLWCPRGNDRVKDAQRDLDRRYARAERRYSWWQRRAELAAIRENGTGAPLKAIPALDRVNITQMIQQGMTVYEPKIGPGGKPLAKQSAVPSEQEKEAILVGR
jgi:hypothetical protein